MVALFETGPANPCALAVMVVVPAATAVTIPVFGSTLATPGMAEDQVTPLVKF